MNTKHLSRASRRAILARILGWSTPIALLATFLFFAASVPYFATLSTFLELLNQTVVLGILALAFLFVHVSGGFDISIGATCSFAGVIAALIFRQSGGTAEAILAGLGVGVLIGIINAFLCGIVKIEPILATLSIMFVVQGIELMITKASGLYPRMPSGFLFLGRGSVFHVPFSVIVLLALALLSRFILRRTRFGANLYATGGNRETARACGINVRALSMSSYVVSGILASFAGIMLTSRLGSAQTMAGEGYLLYAIGAVFLSTTMFGVGQSNVEGSILGAVFMMTISTGLTMANIWWYWQYVVTGLLLLLAVMATSLRRRLSAGL